MTASKSARGSCQLERTGRRRPWEPLSTASYYCWLLSNAAHWLILLRHHSEAVAYYQIEVGGGWDGALPLSPKLLRREGETYNGRLATTQGHLRLGR